jgi:hypothetical protein
VLNQQQRFSSFPTTRSYVSIRKASGNTGITGGLKVPNNKVPTSPKKSEATKKPEHQTGWKPSGHHKTPAKPPPAR